MVTITLPRFSGRAAKRAAAAKFAPELIPAKMPSSRAKRRAHVNASSLVTVSTPVKRLVSRFLGMKPAPMPWILCEPALPPEMTGESVGSTA